MPKAPKGSNTSKPNPLKRPGIAGAQSIDNPTVQDAPGGATGASRLLLDFPASALVRFIDAKVKLVHEQGLSVIPADVITEYVKLQRKYKRDAKIDRLNRNQRLLRTAIRIWWNKAPKEEVEAFKREADEALTAYEAKFYGHPRRAGRTATEGLWLAKAARPSGRPSLSLSTPSAAFDPPTVPQSTRHAEQGWNPPQTQSLNALYTNSLNPLAMPPRMEHPLQPATYPNANQEVWQTPGAVSFSQSAGPQPTGYFDAQMEQWNAPFTAPSGIPTAVEPQVANGQGKQSVEAQEQWNLAASASFQDFGRTQEYSSSQLADLDPWNDRPRGSFDTSALPVASTRTATEARHEPRSYLPTVSSNNHIAHAVENSTSESRVWNAPATAPAEDFTMQPQMESKPQAAMGVEHSNAGPGDAQSHLRQIPLPRLCDFFFNAQPEQEDTPSDTHLDAFAMQSTMEPTAEPLIDQGYSNTQRDPSDFSTSTTFNEVTTPGPQPTAQYSNAQPEQWNTAATLPFHAPAVQPPMMTASQSSAVLEYSSAQPQLQRSISTTPMGAVAAQPPTRSASFASTGPGVPSSHGRSSMFSIPPNFPLPPSFDEVARALGVRYTGTQKDLQNAPAATTSLSGSEMQRQMMFATQGTQMLEYPTAQSELSSVRATTNSPFDAFAIPQPMETTPAVNLGHSNAQVGPMNLFPATPFDAATLPLLAYPEPQDDNSENEELPMGRLTPPVPTPRDVLPDRIPRRGITNSSYYSLYGREASSGRAMVGNMQRLRQPSQQGTMPPPNRPEFTTMVLPPLPSMRFRPSPAIAQLMGKPAVADPSTLPTEEETANLLSRATGPELHQIEETQRFLLEQWGNVGQQELEQLGTALLE